MSKKSIKDTGETLRDRIARLDKQAGQAEDQAANANANALKDASAAFRGANKMFTFFNRAAGVGKEVWNKTGAPVWGVVQPSASWVYNKYRNNVWDRFAFYTSDEGARVFSNKRAALTIAGTFAAAMMVAPVTIGTVKGGVDAYKMATSMRTEIVYLHTPNSYSDGTFSVQGCRTAGECSVDDTIFYNIENSFMRDAWSLLNNGSLHVPQRIISVIPPGANNRCEVTIYGAKHEQFYQNFGFFPELLDVTCSQVGGEASAPDNGNPLPLPAPQMQ